MRSLAEVIHGGTRLREALRYPDRHETGIVKRGNAGAVEPVHGVGEKEKGAVDVLAQEFQDGFARPQEKDGVMRTKHGCNGAPRLGRKHKCVDYRLQQIFFAHCFRPADRDGPTRQIRRRFQPQPPLPIPSY